MRIPGQEAAGAFLGESAARCMQIGPSGQVPESAAADPQARLAEVYGKIARVRTLRTTGDLAVAHSVDPAQAIKDELAEIADARTALDTRDPDGGGTWIFDPRYYWLGRREAPLQERLARQERAARAA